MNHEHHEDETLAEKLRQWRDTIKFRTTRDILVRRKSWEELRQKRPELSRGRRYILLNLICLALAVGVSVLLFRVSDLSREAIFMTGIFVLAGSLWATEALPLFATALVVMSLEIILLANPGGWEGFGFETGESPAYKIFLSPMANPIIFLFLGGFLLAQASVKEGVDKALASMTLRFFGGKPLMVLLGMMSVTAVFSMWMSNTATTAMMMTLVIPMIGQIPENDPIRRGMVISIPFAANIGGMGTPIASPPNAVAVSFLKEAGVEISFMEWMLVAVPLMLGLLLFTWLLIWVIYKPTTPNINLKPTSQKIDARGWFVIFIFSITILLWLTEAWHGLPTAVVALLPAVAFTATGLLVRKDVNSLEWHILILIAGGIALGMGIQKTGLDTVLVGMIPADGQVIIAGMSIATILLSTFMSNTAAANLILPIGISFAFSAANSPDAPDAVQLGFAIALCASLAMSLPVSTPPNVIAYSSGEIHTKDFMKTGIIIGIVGGILVITMVSIVTNFWMN